MFRQNFDESIDKNKYKNDFLSHNVQTKLDEFASYKNVDALLSISQCSDKT